MAECNKWYCAGLTKSAIAELSLMQLNEYHNN